MREYEASICISISLHGTLEPLAFKFQSVARKIQQQLHTFEGTALIGFAG
jgi:hypothetical protein